MSLSRSPAAHLSDLLDADVFSLYESSNLAYSALLASSQEEQDVADEGDDTQLKPSQPACPAYEELLEVMEVIKETPQIACGHLDERFCLTINMQLL